MGGAVIQMSTKRKFFICDECKNIVGLIADGGGELHCCGKPMRELNAGEVDASTEKHVPVCKRNGDVLTVEIGAAEHPQTAEHHIAWIAVCGEGFTQRAELPLNQPPKTEFRVPQGGALTVYAYCNLHGLWAANA